ncbi:MAG: hypothetical protein IJS50_03265 [Desulfovibrio sp.]|nr:hypothetical protein [Desulfovibrio sp.]
MDFDKLLEEVTDVLLLTDELWPELEDKMVKAAVWFERYDYMGTQYDVLLRLRDQLPAAIYIVSTMAQGVPQVYDNYKILIEVLCLIDSICNAFWCQSVIDEFSAKKRKILAERIGYTESI